MFTAYRTGIIDVGNRTRGKAGNIPWIEVDATLFYEGKHRKGEPTWTVEDLDLMHSQFTAPEGDLDWSVPIQLDHSESARDSMGHLRRTWRDTVEVDGKLVEALKGRLRYVGQHAVDNVDAGIWTKLSLSIYTDTKTIREVTVTPFPQLTGARNHHESESNMKTETTAPATAQAQAPEPEAAKPVSNHADLVEQMRAEFAAQTAKQQQQLDKQARLIEEQGKLLRFNELTRIVNSYSEAGKTIPAMRVAELALIETLSDEQIKLYSALKETQPALVSFEVLGTQEEFNADDKSEGERLASYFQQSKGAK